jgi:uncharacterized protein YbjT (DUF2867 family)
MIKILVTGAAGNVGSHLVRELQERGATVRAFVRDAKRAAAKLGPDIELAVGDFEDPASLRRAMRGIDRLFVTSANGPREVAHETATIDAGAAAWVQRIVKLSAIGAEIGSPLMFSDMHARIEKHLADSPVPSVVLNASDFMSNLFAFADGIRHTGRLVAPAGNARIAMIDPRDVAAAAAAALLDDACDRDRYVLTGPHAITYSEVAAELSAATGRAITFVDVPDDAARAGLREAGLPSWLADSIVTLYGLLRQGLAAHPTDDVRVLTGRPPRTFAEFAHDHRAAFGGG